MRVPASLTLLPFASATLGAQRDTTRLQRTRLPSAARIEDLDTPTVR